MKFKRLGFVFSMVGLTILPLFFLFDSCKHEGIPADQFPEVCFQSEILPIFQNSCATCHGGTRSEAGLDFSNYAGIMKAITPGDANKSKAYQAITSTFQLMPPDNALPADKRTLIRLWIEQGAKETTCDTNGNNGSVKSGTLWSCYDRDIQPLLMSSCAVSGCHDAATHKEGYDFSTYAKTLNALKTGSPSTSKLYRVITASQTSEDFMPPKPYSPLSKAAIDTIYSWIKRGALNEECASPCDTTGTITYAGHVKSTIDLYCVSCHGTNSPSGGIKLLTATDVQAVAKTGKLLGAVKRLPGYTAMPQAYALSTCDVKQIELWIKQGYN